MSKKLNAITLSGLMIGPILGSGILFLPPLAYKNLGSSAIIAWIIIMAQGALFAYVFSRITVAVPNNKGVSVIIGKTLGERFGKLSANYLTMAVLFGPVAVSLTAADFIQSTFMSIDRSMIVAASVLIVSALIVLCNVNFMGKIMLVLSTITACLLLVGGLASLFNGSMIALPYEFPPIKELGHTLLLLFWSVVGWEVLGNYVEDVIDPARTMMRAMKISIIAIVSVYLITSFALQSNHCDSMSDLLVPIFGRYSSSIFGFIATGLCIGTIVTFTGAVARQTTARMYSFNLPMLVKNNKFTVLALLLLNLIVLLCNAVGWMSFEMTVAMANTLFLANAVLGLISGFKLIHSIWIRIGISVLLVMMLTILVFSQVYSIIFFTVVTLVSILFDKMMSNK
ncbi:MAG: amino acid permease [Candidatus Metalachnospira sp.]|nr:amino acid permease [Candidatus Metalachnospira sp.]